MDDKTFIFTNELNKRLLKLRYENDWLFKKRKQPWREFHKILLENNFPKEMTVDHVRKKWSYMYDTYKIAKREKNKHWAYYKLFEKIFAQTKVLDRFYETWSNEWRLKLITCVTEAKALKMDYPNMWRTVERALRCQELPMDCCIQDVKGLWQHMKMSFGRKHRLAIRRGAKTKVWPLYTPMLEYYRRFEPEYLVKLEQSDTCPNERPKKASDNYKKYRDNGRTEDEEFTEFQWSKDITESFIQIRLQNDWLFRERKWAWNDLLAIMIEEYGFPKTMSGREISRKWSSTFSDYQKAKATNNRSWVYYNIFELYLGEGSLSLNPIVGWKEEWISNLISVRMDLENVLFNSTIKQQDEAWREVEKRLRSIGLPIDHSLLDLPEIWTHLLKTFRWKKKFADKGMLNEQWPYYDAMLQYDEIRERTPRKHKIEPQDHFDHGIDDYEDDMKLFDLKQKLEHQLKPKFEFLEANTCRSCSIEEACVNIYDQRDENGLNLADKLQVIGGVLVDPSDNLPALICLNCVKELENAHKFRRKCQEVDKSYRSRGTCNIKLETSAEHSEQNLSHAKEEPERSDDDDVTFTGGDDVAFTDDFQMEPEERIPPIVKKEKKRPPILIRKRKKVKKEKYEYIKICEVCGKHTKNLVAHLDTHAIAKLYSCNVCDKKFKFKSGLVIHKAVHEPTPRKTCEICGKTFHILAQYRRHFVYHANERKYECETCGKRFNTLDILRVHNRIHTDERPFTCSECGKTFRTAGCVSRHKRIVHRTAKVQTVQ